MRLHGKVAIVAGAGASGAVIGNGQATAVLFAREGAKVICADAVLERAQATVDLIAKEGGTASAVRADVSKSADCEAMVEAVQRGRIRKLSLERVDGGPVVGSPYEDKLIELGFRPGPRKLTLTA